MVARRTPFTRGIRHSTKLNCKARFEDLDWLDKPSLSLRGTTMTANNSGWSVGTGGDNHADGGARNRPDCRTRFDHLSDESGRRPVTMVPPTSGMLIYLLWLLDAGSDCSVSPCRFPFGGISRRVRHDTCIRSANFVKRGIHAEQ